MHHVVSEIYKIEGMVRMNFIDISSFEFRIHFKTVGGRCFYSLMLPTWNDTWLARFLILEGLCQFVEIAFLERTMIFQAPCNCKSFLPNSPGGVNVERQPSWKASFYDIFLHVLPLQGLEERNEKNWSWPRTSRNIPFDAQSWTVDVTVWIW